MGTQYRNPAIIHLLEESMEKNVKILIEKHPDGFIAYPLGLKGAVVGCGNTETEALANVRSAIMFHVETFGPEVFGTGPLVLDTLLTETGVSV
jgi:predicted RNase H-like HicB family nuclease